jgi:hypothetical protein
MCEWRHGSAHNLGTRLTWSALSLGCFIPRERAPRQPLNWWLGQSPICLDALEKMKTSCPCQESNSNSSVAYRVACPNKPKTESTRSVRHSKNCAASRFMITRKYVKSSIYVVHLTFTQYPQQITINHGHNTYSHADYHFNDYFTSSIPLSQNIILHFTC